ncbi:hypothetical protein [Sphaerisporangium sp. TRM90804]|uniref:hypothetical protein n=1 Tax=Sphaerisporangium sp. TRM90804 TaxID=3031113 RepID=UPI0024469F35|nr:hypothetical protein [Sphaerisporangium sp. TRM90804]MDH2427453.1 hypothetical protein [Sphaerisporangium sp. TRM90804]
MDARLPAKGERSPAARAWPFLVARGRRRGYRVLLAPDFLVARRAHGALDGSVAPGAPGSRPAVTRLTEGVDPPLTVVHATHLLTAADLTDPGALPADREPRDENSRPLHLVYGFTCAGDMAAGDVDGADLRLCLETALGTYRRFLADEERFAVEPGHGFVPRSPVGPAPDARPPGRRPGRAGRPAPAPGGDGRVPGRDERLTGEDGRVTGGGDRVTVGDGRVTHGGDRVTVGDGQVTGRGERRRGEAPGRGWYEPGGWNGRRVLLVSVSVVVVAVLAALWLFRTGPREAECAPPRAIPGATASPSPAATPQGWPGLPAPGPAASTAPTARRPAASAVPEPPASRVAEPPGTAAEGVTCAPGRG